MLIEIENLTKMFGNRAALDDVSMTIDPGQIVAMLGPNGAGKTTLLRCLAGISQAGRGRLLFDGEVFRRDRIDLRKRFHFVPDFPFVYPEATVLQHLTMILKAYLSEDDPVEETVIELLEEFEILPLIDSQVSKLSRGQTYKVALTASRRTVRVRNGPARDRRVSSTCSRSGQTRPNDPLLNTTS
jgi:ABC-2 type transport system ATP-binding protein